MDLNEVKVDKSKESDGVWVDIDEDTRILVASDVSPAYKRMLKKELLPYQKAIRLNTMKDKVYEEVASKCMAKHILLDWEGITKDGMAFPYSEENSLLLMTDDSYSQFRDFVAAQSMDLTLFRVSSIDDVKDEIKKS